MKEKTFEELITEKRRSSINRTLYDNDIKELMQLVLEATKAECMRIYEDDWGKYTGYKLMEALPTDRIKTEK